MTYCELVVDGRRSFTLGFVEGFLSARDVAGRVLDAEAEGFDCEPLGEHLRELLYRSAERLHLLVPEELVPTVREAVTAAARFHPAAVRAERAVTGARFAFSVTAFAREHAARVRALFEAVPPGAALTPDTAFHERLDPQAQGAALYTPAHAYEWRGAGAVEGTVDAVLAVSRACRDDELVRAERLRLLPGRPSA